MMDLVAPVLAVLGFVVVFGGLFGLVRWLGRVVHRAIEAFAKQHGLSYHDDKIRPLCEGEFEGRTVRVANEIGVYPWGFKLRAVPMFVVYVEVRGAPSGAWLAAQFGGAVQTDGTRQIVEVDPSFDSEVFTIAADPEGVRAWLTAPRKQAIRRMVQTFKRDGVIEQDRVFVEEGWIVFRTSHMQKARASWIEEVVRALLPHAHDLEVG